MPSTAYTPSFASASSTARRLPATSVPTVRIRVTPASRARAMTAAGSSSSASRCACVSIMRLQAQPRELLRRSLRRELAEERPRLAQLLARRQLARRPGADPALVLAGQHLVRGAVLLGDRLELERPGQVAVIAQE